MSILSIRNIHKSFGALEVLKGIDTDIARGEMVSIVGASGAGKTTLLQVMGTLLRPDEGSITLADTDVTRLGDAALSRFRNQHIGFIFQFHQLLPEFTALENVMLPALIAGQSKRAAANRAAELLDFMGLTARAEHKPTELSGGEQQRVAAARALTNRPDIVFADEPTGNLDSVSTDQVLEILRRSVDDLGQSVVMVTHEPEAAAWADTVIFLRDGHVVAELADPNRDRVLDALRELSETGRKYF